MQEETSKKKIQINKLDAARRQLLTAIRLYFNNGDIVSTHTLAAASCKITQNICDSSPDLPDSCIAWFIDWIKPGCEKTFYNKIHETANFFKHADQDPTAVHEFYPAQTENLLFMAVYQYHIVTREWSPEIRLFMTWYMAHYPEIFRKSPEQVQPLVQAFGEDKTGFWRGGMSLLQKELDEWHS